MKLPQRFVDEGLEMAKGSCLFGVPLEELTHEELLAATAQGWASEKRAREDAIKQFEFGRVLGGARGR